MLQYVKDFFYNPPKDTRFYYLSLIYEDDTWSIHGLWPQTDKNDYPQFCREVTFDISLLEPIIDSLRKYWRSDRGPDSSFWEHEWKKHGSCMFDNLNEFEYFNKTLTLFDFVTKNNLIDTYKKGDKALIPFSLDFEIIP
tara:strand:- start:222 stop:638 length:417 start_codon:yes stop_codon:yes gene_type:complete